jgi:excisionase family DNA binding protein
MTTASGRFLTPDEVAVLLAVDRKTVYRLIESGTLPCLRVGRLFRVSPSALDSLRYEGRTPPAARHVSIRSTRRSGAFTRLARRLGEPGAHEDHTDPTPD